MLNCRPRLRVGLWPTDTKPSTSSRSGLGDARDKTIWEYALGAGAAIISKDEDFAQRRVLEAAGPAIVWIRPANTRRRGLLGWFDGMFPKIVQALARGETLIEVI